ncbi:hypothetical protein N836_03120 [Leptolyngbya sp. Heron Island J]|uniref:hypothetical protein n=1 Tax=Leptolyngbya sp. Heron Island J TaxID=1385935 RepID=UPI0003B96C10|nr:hypothetical protein [Leptolyngbya sp. Heron Island J]ESA37395.1 hypothetical protein N836_03120 [Leptolyngbya sp. Heron Island J]
MTDSVVAQKFENIASWMTSTRPTKLPDVLKGVFFMDGNPLPDDCITMYNLDWDEQTNCLTLPVTGPTQWTFHSNLLGWFLLLAAKISHFRYKIEFEDDSLQQAQITPITFGIPVPRWILDATMCQHENTNNGDLWDRKNVWFGGLPRVGEYVLRRIVDENGQYTPAFQDMLKKVDPECLVIAQDTEARDS